MTETPSYALEPVCINCGRDIEKAETIHGLRWVHSDRSAYPDAGLDRIGRVGIICPEHPVGVVTVASPRAPKEAP